jgi:putative transposase
MNFAMPKWRQSCYNSLLMIVQKAYKYRFYPSNTQARQLANTFGSARFVWNLGLELRSKSHEQEQKSISYTQTAAALTQWEEGT